MSEIRMRYLPIIAALCSLFAFSFSVCADRPATRTEAAAVLFACAEENASVTQNETAELLARFSDTSEVADADKPVLAFGIQSGFLQGYPDGTLRPYDSVTRGEFAVMAYRAKSAFRVPEPIVSFCVSYPDLDEWCRNEAAFFLTRGVLLGYGDRFGTDDPLTVDQTRLIVARLQSFRRGYL